MMLNNVKNIHRQGNNLPQLNFFMQKLQNIAMNPRMESNIKRPMNTKAPI